jgi:molecular chaperone DnaJ
VTHYERLGVAVDASPGEIRDAYRRAARVHHPDANGGRSALVMAEVNQAWWVLRDADRRRAYDLSLPMGPSAPRPWAGSSTSTGSASGAPASSARVASSPAGPGGGHPAFDRLVNYQPPARFPWRFMAVLASIGILIVLLGVIITKPSKPVPPDNVLGPGSCIVVQQNDDVAEVNCTDTHDGVVEVLVSFGERCPTGTEPHRDRQGMGTACIRRSGR